MVDVSIRFLLFHERIGPGVHECVYQNRTKSNYLWQNVWLGTLLFILNIIFMRRKGCCLEMMAVHIAMAFLTVWIISGPSISDGPSMLGHGFDSHEMTSLQGCFTVDSTMMANILKMYFCSTCFSQLVTNWWFGLVVWISGIPLWKGLLLGGAPRIPNQ